MIKNTVLILAFLIPLYGCGHYEGLRMDSSAQYRSPPPSTVDSSAKIRDSERRERKRLNANGMQQDAAELTPIKPFFSAIDRGEIDDSLVPFEDSKNHLYGYKNRSGRIVIRSKFAVALNFNQHGIADVLLDTKNKPNRIWVKINKSGKILTYSYFFDNGPDYFERGLSRFVEKDKIGFIDYKARKVVSAQFDWASPFHFDLPVAVVCKGCKSDGLGEYPEMKGGKWGAIDSKGKIIVPLEYDKQHIAESHNPDDTLTFLKDKKLYQVFQMQNGDYKTIESSFAIIQLLNDFVQKLIK